MTAGWLPLYMLEEDVPLLHERLNSDPDLNWIEDFWEHLKDTYFSRMLTQQREAFYPDAVCLLSHLRHSGQLSGLALRETL